MSEDSGSKSERFGLTVCSSKYSARRILEKFSLQFAYCRHLSIYSDARTLKHAGVALAWFLVN